MKQFLQNLIQRFNPRLYAPSELPPNKSEQPKDHDVGRWTVYIERFLGYHEDMVLCVSGCPNVYIHPPKYSDPEYLAFEVPNVLTNGGRDWMHAQTYINTSAGTRGAGFIAVSSDTNGASATHTAVAGEIASGGLERADATGKTHTNGTNSSTLQNTFTASAQHLNVQLGGVLNAGAAGILVNENTFTPASLESGDTLTITGTFNIT